MIILVRRETGPIQRALVECVYCPNIVALLLGTDEKVLVHPQDIVGVEINEHLTIEFRYTGHKYSTH